MSYTPLTPAQTDKIIDFLINRIGDDGRRKIIESLEKGGSKDEFLSAIQNHEFSRLKFLTERQQDKAAWFLSTMNHAAQQSLQMRLRQDQPHQDTMIRIFETANAEHRQQKSKRTMTTNLLWTETITKYIEEHPNFCQFSSKQLFELTKQWSNEELPEVNSVDRNRIVQNLKHRNVIHRIHGQQWGRLNGTSVEPIL